MFARLFASHVYVRVKRNEFRVRYIESGVDTTLQAQRPFTSVRLLVGDFTAAQHALKTALRDLPKFWGLTLRPRLLIQPLELIEGGLSEIERRVFLELALGAGASTASVWVGPELGDIEVIQKLREP